jgi:membrane-associated phospholipid phosphatase
MTSASQKLLKASSDVHGARPNVRQVSDHDLFLTVNDWARHSSWLHGIARLFANDGVVLFGLLLVLGGVFSLRRSRLLVVRSVLSGAAVLLAVGLNQPIVHAVNRARPFTVFPHALVLVHRSVDASFPSDHATMAGAVAIGLLFVHRQLGLIAAVLAVLMALTRVYVGVHFPLDVVAGLALGGLVAAVLQLAAPALHALVSSSKRRSPDTFATAPEGTLEA